MIIGQIIIKVEFLSILPKIFALWKFLMLVKKNSCSFGSYILPVNVRADDEGSKILISAQTLGLRVGRISHLSYLQKILHLLIVGIRSVPLLRSRYNHPPLLVAHDLHMFPFCQNRFHTNQCFLFWAKTHFLTSKKKRRGLGCFFFLRISLGKITQIRHISKEKIYWICHI